MQNKGIAIRINEDLYNKIEKQNIPRNDLVTDALIQYFSSPEGHQLEKQEIPSDVYDEVYNTLYNSEIVPLKAKIKHQEEIVLMLQQSINSLKDDKKFLQEQCSNLISTYKYLKKERFWKRNKK